ncbi:hypothetical protein ACQUD9_07570 [Vagococcus fluvialis]|uniref:hypothetical protein n=1 Tax=Vagococcus fluvialis TaxID=2738 RepID=UPI003D0DD2D7
MKKGILKTVILLSFLCSFSISFAEDSFDSSDIKGISIETIDTTDEASYKAESSSSTEPIEVDHLEEVTSETKEIEEIPTEVEFQSFYISVVKPDVIIWEEIDVNQKGTTTEILNQTFLVKEKKITEDNREFLLLVNHSNEEIGYVLSEAVSNEVGEQGLWQSNNQFVSFKSNAVNVYSSFTWSLKSLSNEKYLETLHAKGVYHHFNGKKYLSLYDGKGTWIGYVEESDLIVSSGRQGPFNATDKYVIISKNNYSIYQNFSWSVKNNTSKLMNNTYRVKGFYRHFNGLIYYSLYDGKGTWQGYVNQGAAKETQNAHGEFIGSNKYVTISNKNYPTYNSFNWNVRHNSGKLFEQTFRVKGYYHHFNGSIYYSLYDNQNKWYGYINKNAVKEGNGRQGSYIAENQYVTVTNPNYDVWQNFDWRKKGKSNVLHQKTYFVKGKYNHFNGSTYYSLYDNGGNWQGYVNANAVGFSRRVSTFLETTDEKILSHLNQHESSSFYLGTPYRSVLVTSDPNYVMSPRGKPNWYGAGMNCVGFVAYAYREGGANLNKIAQVSNQWGGPGNAYNWRNALTKNTDYSTFNSIEGLLASGKAKKGDIIYFEPNYFLPGPDPHIGIFWGNSSSHNRFFHSTVPGVKISNIYSGTPYSKVYLFPL